MPLQQNNAHDALFKETFSLVREVRAFIIHFLAPKFWEDLDLDSLEIEDGSYVDEELKGYFADIIYDCRRKNGEKIKLSFLFEHKSYYDKGIPLQLLDYLYKGYRRQYLNKSREKLGYILPILLYHGKQKWEKYEFVDMMHPADGELIPYLPTFRYEVVDLGVVADQLLFTETTGVLLPPVLLLFKHKDNKEFILTNSPKIFTFVERELDEHEKKRMILVMVRYIFAVHKLNQKEIKDFNKKLTPMTQAIVGSYADTLLKRGAEMGREKGREEGRQEGREEGREEEREISTTLSHITMLCILCKTFPQHSDASIAKMAKCPTKMTAEVRLLLQKTSANKAEKIILEKYFKDLELTDKQKKDLFESVRDFYKKE